MKLWAQETNNPAEILEGMMRQHARLGFPAAKANVRSPIKLRPVIAIAEPIKNAKEANSRMPPVIQALKEHGVSLPELELWVIKEDDTIEKRQLGEL